MERDSPQMKSVKFLFSQAKIKGCPSSNNVGALARRLFDANPRECTCLNYRFSENPEDHPHPCDISKAWDIAMTDAERELVEVIASRDEVA